MIAMIIVSIIQIHNIFMVVYTVEEPGLILRYFVDVRGITTDFSEFMKDVNEFVDGEYTVRPLLEEDVKSWETDSYFRKEGYGFAKAIINKYKCCYTL